MLIYYLYILLEITLKVMPTQSVFVTVCQWEFFEAKCDNHAVIVIEKARYGRLKLGRCVKNDYGHLGCSMDALHFMQSTCSAQRQCRFRVYDSGLRQMNACPEDISSYLEVTYRCLQVENPQRELCSRLGYLTLSPPSGYIASIDGEEGGYGSSECPWVLEAKEGQVIQLSLLYFPKLSMSPERHDGCYELAVIFEESSQKSVVTCDVLHKDDVIFKSLGHRIRIELVNTGTLATMGKFILHYKVTSCPDFAAPPNTISHRTGDSLAIRCNVTDEVWYLGCKDNVWVGDIANCSDSRRSQWGLQQIFNKSGFPYGLVIIVAAGVALGIFCGGLLLTFASMYMKRRRRYERPEGDASRAMAVMMSADNSSLRTLGPLEDDALAGHMTMKTKYYDATYVEDQDIEQNKSRTVILHKSDTLKRYETPKFV